MGAIGTALLAVLIIVAVAAAAFALFGKAEEKDSRGRTKKKAAPEVRAAAAATRRAGRFSRRPAWFRFLPIALLGGAIVCLVLAAMQFTVAREETEGTVLLTMDTSQSMAQTDVAPSRLAAAEAAAQAFLDELPEGFRVGLVTFAGTPTTNVRPGVDRDAVASAFPGEATGRGTVIGDGLAAALDAIEADRASTGDRPAAVLLLSDGNDTGSLTSPSAAADRASALEIPVFTVVLGTAETGANTGLLSSIAETTGGESFSAATSGELTGIYELLGSELSTRLAIEGTGPLFVGLGALLAVAAGVLVLLTSRPRY